ncbi:MAG: TusE/DsrC/DsvC family sulfur relay protein [Flavobacteriaceae bacterium]
MKKNIAQTEIEVNEEGYMTDFSQWNKEVGVGLAKEQGIDMTDRHWDVINYIHDMYKKDEPLSIRGIKKSGILDIKEFYDLFPGGPLKKATLIAGIPKPKSCI